jgi:hypothetical protein
MLKKPLKKNEKIVVKQVRRHKGNFAINANNLYISIRTLNRMNGGMSKELSDKITSFLIKKAEIVLKLKYNLLDMLCEHIIRKEGDDKYKQDLKTLEDIYKSFSSNKEVYKYNITNFVNDDTEIKKLVYTLKLIKSIYLGLNKEKKTDLNKNLSVQEFDKAYIFPDKLFAANKKEDFKKIYQDIRKKSSPPLPPLPSPPSPQPLLHVKETIDEARKSLLETALILSRKIVLQDKIPEQKKDTLSTVLLIQQPVEIVKGEVDKKYILDLINRTNLRIREFTKKNSKLYTITDDKYIQLKNEDLALKKYEPFIKIINESVDELVDVYNSVDVSNDTIQYRKQADQVETKIISSLNKLKSKWTDSFKEVFSKLSTIIGQAIINRYIKTFKIIKSSLEERIKEYGDIIKLFDNINYYTCLEKKTDTGGINTYTIGEHIKLYEKMGSPSSNGKLYFTTVNDKLIISKVMRYTTKNKNETNINEWITNNLILKKASKHFALTYKTTECIITNDLDKGEKLVNYIELCKGDLSTLKNTIKGQILINIIFQALIAIATYQYRVGFCHLDAHEGNFLYKDNLENKDGYYYYYTYNEQKFYIKSCIYNIFIIDFGLSEPINIVNSVNIIEDYILFISYFQGIYDNETNIIINNIHTNLKKISSDIISSKNIDIFNQIIIEVFKVYGEKEGIFTTVAPKNIINNDPFIINRVEKYLKNNIDNNLSIRIKRSNDASIYDVEKIKYQKVLKSTGEYSIFEIHLERFFNRSFPQYPIAKKIMKTNIVNIHNKLIYNTIYEILISTSKSKHFLIEQYDIYIHKNKIWQYDDKIIQYTELWDSDFNIVVIDDDDLMINLLFQAFICIATYHNMVGFVYPDNTIKKELFLIETNDYTGHYSYNYVDTEFYIKSCKYNIIIDNFGLTEPISNDDESNRKIHQNYKDILTIFIKKADSEKKDLSKKLTDIQGKLNSIKPSINIFNDIIDMVFKNDVNFLSTKQPNTNILNQTSYKIKSTDSDEKKKKEDDTVAQLKNISTNEKLKEIVEVYISIVKSYKVIFDIELKVENIVKECSELYKKDNISNQLNETIMSHIQIIKDAINVVYEESLFINDNKMIEISKKKDIATDELAKATTEFETIKTKIVAFNESNKEHQILLQSKKNNLEKRIETYNLINNQLNSIEENSCLIKEGNGYKIGEIVELYEIISGGNYGIVYNTRVKAVESTSHYEIASKLMASTKNNKNETKINAWITQNLILTQHSKHFILTYKSTECIDKKNSLDLNKRLVNYNELCEGSLYHLILDINKEQSPDFNLINNIYIQAIICIATYQNRVGYVHGDIKTENFLYQKNSDNKQGYYHYIYNSKDFYIKNNKYNIMISDFGGSKSIVSSTNITKDYTQLINYISKDITNKDNLFNALSTLIYNIAIDKNGIDIFEKIIEGVLKLDQDICVDNKPKIILNINNPFIINKIEDYLKLDNLSGGNPPKYKSTGKAVYILYKKKKYKRTIYVKDKRKTKYCKINNEYILLSKLKVLQGTLM